jgi:hypothetical protein
MLITFMFNKRTDYAHQPKFVQTVKDATITIKQHTADLRKPSYHNPTTAAAVIDKPYLNQANEQLTRNTTSFTYDCDTAPKQNSFAFPTKLSDTK